MSNNLFTSCATIAGVNHNAPLIRPATTLDDVCAIVGWSRTVALVRWFGGANLYVPAKADDDHALLVVLGRATLDKLIEEFGGTTVWVPANLGGGHNRADEIKRDVRRLVLKGHGSQQISQHLSIGQRQAQRVRLELEAAGMLPKILREKSPEKTP